MGLKGFLYSQFPHRWLDNKAEGTKRLFDGLFLCLEYATGYVDFLVPNSRTRTAEALLSELEDEYGLSTEPSLDINVRRGRVIAKKRAQDWPVTKEQLLDIFRAMGISAEIVNYHNNYRLELNISANEHGVSYSEIYGLLNGNVRAHVEVGIVTYAETQLAGGILIDVSSMQHMEYENTATEHLYKLSYASAIPADIGVRPSQEMVFDTISAI